MDAGVPLKTDATYSAIPGSSAASTARRAAPGGCCMAARASHHPCAATPEAPGLWLERRPSRDPQALLPRPRRFPGPGEAPSGSPFQRQHPLVHKRDQGSAFRPAQRVPRSEPLSPPGQVLGKRRTVVARGNGSQRADVEKPLEPGREDLAKTDRKLAGSGRAEHGPARGRQRQCLGRPTRDGAVSAKTATPRPGRTRGAPPESGHHPPWG